MPDINPEFRSRKSIRINGFNYAQAGYYFITICTHQKEHVFGKVQSGIMHLNNFGEIVRDTWDDLPNHNSNIELDYYCIMPNHIHGIIIISDCAQSDTIAIEADMVRAGLEPAPTGHSLAELVRQLKTFSSVRINKLRHISGEPVWQRNYYEHIIRNEPELYLIRKYISNNPMNWDKDEYFI